MNPRVSLPPVPGRSELARARLIEAALEQFGDQGPDGATLRGIARAAGQNVAAVAYYFGSKRKLYHAIIEAIVREVRGQLAEVLAEVARSRRQGAPPPAEAMRLLKLWARTVYLRLLSRNEAVTIARLIFREQVQPTAGFEIFYAQAFRELHEALCFLVGAVLRRDPRDRKTIIRTHALMGQVYFFAMSRETILRRLGWRSLEGKNAELVADVLAEHIEVLLSGLAETKVTGSAPRSKIRVRKG
jgi:TetR/AcrR family transcriptional regulator, regulator of cefoperazone and chloramphenicol sensitivity